MYVCMYVCKALFSTDRACTTDRACKWLLDPTTVVHCTLMPEELAGRQDTPSAE
jgi:hypothetical protein